MGYNGSDSTIPGERLTPYLPEEPFFDPAIPVDHIDLRPIRTGGTFLAKGSLDGRKVVRFLTTVGSGPIDDELFETCFNEAGGDMLAGVEPERLSEMYDALEQLEPRYIDILARIQAERFYDEEHMQSVTKLSLLFATYRRLHEYNGEDPIAETT
jgi:hypothetical protein